MEKSETLRFDCKACWARPDSEWSVLDDSEREYLDRTRRASSYRPGESVFRQDDNSTGLYCIQSGHMVLKQFDSFDNETVLRVVLPGETIGYRSFFSETPHAATATALTLCRICLVPAAAIRQLIEGNVALASRFLKTLARDRGPTEAPLLRGPHLSVRVRILNLLLILREDCATDLPDGSIRFQLPIKRQDIAAMVGTRPETVSRVVRELREDGVAVFHRQQVDVPDIDRVLELAHMSMST
jgi:CRP/FNR family transcriptional regulator, polysaccharide utilization system transcription regulator